MTNRSKSGGNLPYPVWVELINNALRNTDSYIDIRKDILKFIDNKVYYLVDLIKLFVIILKKNGFSYKGCKLYY